MKNFVVIFHKLKEIHMVKKVMMEVLKPKDIAQDQI